MTERRFQGKVIHDNPCLGPQATLSGPKWKKLTLSLTGSSDVTTLGWSLPTDSIVHDVMVYVNTAEATGTTKTIDVGVTSGANSDVDGFIDGISVASTGWKYPQVTITGTDGFATTTRGALLAELNAGAGATDSAYAAFPHVSASIAAKALCANAATSDFAELEADLYVLYSELV